MSVERDEHIRYLRARFPRVTPTPLGLGQLRGFEEPPGDPMRLFAPGARALAAFWRLWNDDAGMPYSLQLECGHPLPEPPQDRDHMPLHVPCIRCGVDVGLHIVEAF